MTTTAVANEVLTGAETATETNTGLQTWAVDAAHTVAHFSVRHMMVSNVRGMFSKVTGELALNREHPERSIISISIDPASVETREAARDTHLKSADFFDVENFPEMSFTSSKFERVGPGEYKVTGDLTMHGVTKSEVFHVEGLDEEMKDPWGNTKIGAIAKAKVNRKDFNLGWNAVLEAGGVVVGEEVKIEFEVEFAKS